MDDIFVVGRKYVLIYDDMEQKPKKKEGILLRKEFPTLEFQTIHGKEVLNMNRIVRAGEVENTNVNQPNYRSRD